MKRREFFRRIGGAGLATPIVPIPQARLVPTDAPRSYPCQAWRGYVWWIDDRHHLRWKRDGEGYRARGVLVFPGPYDRVDRLKAIAAAIDDTLWLVTDRGLVTLQFTDRPTDARLMYRAWT